MTENLKARVEKALNWVIDTKMLEAKRISLEKLGLSAEKIAQVFPWKHEEQIFSQKAVAMRRRIEIALQSILADSEK